MEPLSLIYNPDHQQVLGHHQELLEAAEQARLASQVPREERPQTRGLELFRRLFAGRPAPRLTQTTNTPR